MDLNGRALTRLEVNGSRKRDERACRRAVRPRERRIEAVLAAVDTLEGTKKDDDEMMRGCTRRENVTDLHTHAHTHTHASTQQRKDDAQGDQVYRRQRIPANKKKGQEGRITTLMN